MGRPALFPRSAGQIFLLIELSKGFLFMTALTLAGLYRIQTAGLSPFELLLVGAGCEATVLLFEVPTGVVADTVSRRRSVIIGFFIVGVGFVIEGAFPTFGAILFAHVLWGLGSTFISGADVAWIADEVGSARASQLYVRGAQLSMLGGAAGIGASVALGSYSLALPSLVAGVLLGLLGVVLYFVMPEVGFRPPPHQDRKHVLASMREILQGGVGAVRTRPLLGVIFVIAGLLGMSNEAFDRLWEFQLLKNFSFPQIAGLGTVIWFGMINAGGLLLGVVATEVVHRRLDTSSHVVAARALATGNGVLMGLFVVFGLAGQLVWALLAYWSIALIRGVTTPIYTAWLNQELSSATRATVNSFSSQCNALGQIAGGPLLGQVANHSIRWAMVLSGVLHLPVTLLLAWILRPKPQPAPPAAVD